MSKFVLKNIVTVHGKQTIRQLVIINDNVNAIQVQKEIDGIEAGIINNMAIEDIDGINPGQLDNYENSLETKYQSKFLGILTYMNLVADLQSVPETKFKFLKTQKNESKEFEFKNGDLRVLGIDVFGGKIILLGGFKNSQPSDIVQMRALKKLYFESLHVKKVKNEKGRLN